jgi:hypothetical protein
MLIHFQFLYMHWMSSIELSLIGTLPLVNIPSYLTHLFVMGNQENNQIAMDNNLFS